MENAVENKKENPLWNILLNVVIPSVIMTKFSKPEYLGQKWGLIIALLFPFLYGLKDYFGQKKVNFFSALGLFSVLVTGGIGLFKLSKDWMVVKETAIPFIMGLAILISQKTTHPLVRIFLNQIMYLDRINDEFVSIGQGDQFEKKISISSYLLALTFFLSAALNYFLAVYILKGSPGSVEFNESLGKMTALSFPVITIPMMIMVGLIMANLLHTIKKYTKLELESVFKT